MGDDTTHFHPAWSYNKETFESGEADGLSWYASSSRSDFLFRTGIFEGFPPTTYKNSFNFEANREYLMQATLSKTWAVYYIDGAKYGEVMYNEKDVP